MKSLALLRHAIPPTHPHKRLRRGSVFIEFALILPILIGLVLGVIQYGLIAQSTEVVTTLSREGARFGTLGAGKTDEEIANRIKTAAANTVVDAADLQIVISQPDGETRKQGSQLIIAVTYNLKKKVFLPGSSYLLEKYKQPPSNDPLYTATAKMRIVGE